MNAQTNSEALVPQQQTSVQQQIEAVKAKYDPKQYNLVLHTATVMDALPPGVVMVPQIVNIPPNEIWDKRTNPKLSFLPEGQCELAATAIKRIGTAAGVKLRRVTEEVKKVDGKTMLLIEYEASMMMPDGTVHSEIGGKEEAYSGQHAREKIDTKAKRNAVRQLLNLPITIPVDAVAKPFMVLKPVFYPGYSPQADQAYGAIQAGQQAAVAKLYPGAAQPTVDVKSEPVNLASLTQDIEDADTIDNLKAIGEQIARLALTGDERRILEDCYKARKHYLETGEATPQQVAEAQASQPAPQEQVEPTVPKL